MIPDETVDRVREAADIVQIVSEYVTLKRTGTDWRGPCPFHQGTHRNFSVSPKRGRYHCFVCGEGGDVFTFVQKRLGMDFTTAVKFVGERSGVEVREVETRRRSEPDPREPLWEVNAAAAEYFRRVLWEEELGAPARAYLAERAVTREVADRFGLGFAPREIGLMRAHLAALGFSDDRMVEAGLLVRPEENAELRPRFRNRLIFPIYDVSGRAIAFGGRLIGPGEPKYLNSAESPLFTKGKTLYGLNWAKHAIRKDERVLVVEGYFDVVRLVAAGVESVVAPLGTALTEAQAELIRKYTTHAFLLYDSDEAGLKATFRSGLELLRQGASVRVVTLPEGEDPDTFVASQGAAALERQLAEAIDVFDRQVQILERRGWFADLHRKRRAIDKLLPTIRATVDELTRDIYVARLADAAGVDKALLVREVAAAPDEPRAPRRPERGVQRPRSSGDAPGANWGPGDSPMPVEPPYEAPPPPDDVPEYGAPYRGKKRFEGKWKKRNAGPEWQANDAPPRASMGAGVAPERNLVSLLLVHRALVALTVDRIDPAQLDDERMRAIFRALREVGGEASLDEVAALLDDSTQALCFELAQQDPPVVAPTESTKSAEQALEGILRQLAVRTLDRRAAQIDREMAAASDEEKDRLMREKLDIQQQKQQLGARQSKLYGRRKDPRGNNGRRME